VAGATRTACANSIFQQPWWLDAVAPGRWSEAAIERDGRTVARLPYVVLGRGRMRVLTQPPLTQTLGPWVETDTGAKPANALAREMELLTELEQRLPAYQAFLQMFSPRMLNALPFHWAGYGLEAMYTYRLEDLSSEQTLWDGLRGNVRREIRKARRSLEIREDLGFDRFAAELAKGLESKGLRSRRLVAALARVEDACAARDARCMLFAVDAAGRVHAVTYVVWDERGAYYLAGGGDPALRTSGASSLLMWEAITRAREVTASFDFEGSLLQPVERFFRAFGARQALYLRVTRATPPVRVALAVRRAARRMARCRG
jgi:hypothetical protein